MKKSIAFLAALPLLFALAACGGDEPDSTSQSGSDATQADFNDADVSFAQNMIVHHQQALDMTDLAEGRDLDPEFQQLVDDIRTAQEPEIETMTSWLESWGEDVPESGMSGMDHGGMDMGDSMGGMMTEEDMSSLDAAEGDEFRTMFLEMMIGHHKGAIDMAKTEQANGSNAEAVALADDIVSAQEAEVAKMEDMLASS
ncbi:DUF305 domain-containing protein [Nocardioides sp. SOB77]|uniref:DUF305 domain-containing protein n=1 Tax=Nocardioides oceani TaxID=3058369 RepID=A0ABT8FMC1_9ACTN|nr:DUF305 domain-containing protein [Nocardioides oceani]MDN4175821.1 DUF305 domain-containing protein [Nocardioides oceani]